jgi:hypothetical protein
MAIESMLVFLLDLQHLKASSTGNAVRMNLNEGNPDSEKGEAAR